MRHALLFLSFLFYSCVIAQTRNPAQDINRTNIWRFGDASTPGANDVPGLDFNSGSPVVINSGTNPLFSTTSSISDLNGNPQLYGSYQSIYDRTDNFLSNAGVVGDSGKIGIHPCNLAIPMPKSPNLIYYFTAQTSLKYSVIDMNLNNGKGQAVVRNVILEQIPVEAKLAAIHHCNGSDVWIVGHRWDTNTFYAYLLTDTGIVIPPVITSIGPKANENGTFQQGAIRFSPNGNKLVIVFNGINIPPYLFDFDKSTGVISNPIPLQKDEADNGVSFSPDNSKLYISTNNGVIVQYNLFAGNAVDIVNSKKTIFDQLTTFPAMQIGRDGRIYITVVGSTTGSPNKYHLSVINKPNSLDTLCELQLNSIYLNGGQGVGNSFMNTVQSYFYTGSSAYPCYGDTLTGISSVNNSECVKALVYPNPSNGVFNVELNSDEIVNLKVFDAIGNIVYQKTTFSNSDSPINLTNNANGMYLFSFSKNDNQQQIKVLKQ